mmetsp:Transcript_40871/g.46993  ORF Transcript_40871/g.46993 Transcript_40871/m.46993 type:complete len:190 (-) Transcript_40871:316-885(-)
MALSCGIKNTPPNKLTNYISLLDIRSGLSVDGVLSGGHTGGLVVSSNESVAAEVTGSYLLRQGVPEPLVRCDGGAGIGGSVTLDLSDVDALRVDCQFTWPGGADMPDGISWSGSPLPASSIALDTCLSKWDGKETKIVELELPVFCSYGAWTSYVTVNLIFSAVREHNDHTDLELQSQTEHNKVFLEYS